MSVDHDLWLDALDRLDAHVDELSAALDSGDISVVSEFTIPVGLPAPPLTCARRAREVEQRHVALQDRVRQQLLDTSAQVQRTRSPNVPHRRAARFEALA